MGGWVGGWAENYKPLLSRRLRKKHEKTIKTRENPRKHIKNHDKPSKTTRNHRKTSQTIKTHEKTMEKGENLSKTLPKRSLTALTRGGGDPYSFADTCKVFFTEKTLTPRFLCTNAAVAPAHTVHLYTPPSCLPTSEDSACRVHARIAVFVRLRKTMLDSRRQYGSRGPGGGGDVFCAYLEAPATFRRQPDDSRTTGRRQEDDRKTTSGRHPRRGGERELTGVAWGRQYALEPA